MPSRAMWRACSSRSSTSISSGWIHTPGHTPGHVSFFRDADRFLIAGDAFVTTRQESVWSVITRRPEVWRPPAYFTQDWGAARRSVEELARLEPSIAATGHGVPLGGERMRRELRALAANFDRWAVPGHGRYVRRPVIADERGVVAVPPPAADALPLVLAGVGAAAVVGSTLLRGRGRQEPATAMRGASAETAGRPSGTAPARHRSERDRHSE